MISNPQSTHLLMHQLAYYINSTSNKNNSNDTTAYHMLLHWIASQSVIIDIKFVVYIDL